MPDREITSSPSYPSPCPVLDDQAAIVALSNDLARTIRRLNRDLQACEKCPVVAGRLNSFDDQSVSNRPAAECCSILASINSIIDTAIQQVTDEWNLAGPNHK